MKTLLFLLITATAFAVEPVKKTEKQPDIRPVPRLVCQTRITYRHRVYGLRCPYSEVMLGIIYTSPYYVECGKLETFCY